MSEQPLRVFTIPVSSTTEPGQSSPVDPQTVKQLVADLRKTIAFVQDGVVVPDPDVGPASPAQAGIAHTAAIEAAPQLRPAESDPAALLANTMLCRVR